MTSSDPTGGNWVPPGEPQRIRRMSLRRKVSLKFKEFQGFVNEYSENVSTGGMFIRTPSPQPVGTVFDFEFTLGDDYTLIHGIGEVAWTREADEGFDRPAGMGVRFLNLDPGSRKLIDQMVQERLDREAKQKSPPSETERPWGELSAPAATAWADDAPEPADEADSDRRPLLFPSDPSAESDDPFPRRSGPSPYVYARSYRGSGVANRTRRTRPLLVVLLAIALVVAGLAAFFLFFPETAVNLLVGGHGGDDQVVEVRASASEAEAAEPPPASGAAAGPEGAPETGADEAAAGSTDGAAEPELGFFEPAQNGAAASAPPPAPAPAPAPEPAPVPAPARTPPPPPPNGAGAPQAGFSRILNVVWEERGAELQVTIFLDGQIQEWDYSTVRLDKPPREVVRIDGIDQPFPRTEIPVGDRLLDRIRIGFHPEGRTRQVHVVLDLASPGVQIDRTEAVGSELRIYLARGNGG